MISDQMKRLNGYVAGKNFTGMYSIWNSDGLELAWGYDSLSSAILAMEFYCGIR